MPLPRRLILGVPLTGNPLKPRRGEVPVTQVNDFLTEWLFKVLPLLAFGRSCLEKKHETHSFGRSFCCTRVVTLGGTRRMEVAFSVLPEWHRLQHEGPLNRHQRNGENQVEGVISVVL